MPDPGSPWERENPNDGFGYLPFPIRSAADQRKWDECSGGAAAAPNGPNDNPRHPSGDSHA